jgi:hypothetical protein
MILSGLFIAYWAKYGRHTRPTWLAELESKPLAVRTSSSIGLSIGLSIAVTLLLLPLFVVPALAVPVGLIIFAILLAGNKLTFTEMLLALLVLR